MMIKYPRSIVAALFVASTTTLPAVDVSELNQALVPGINLGNSLEAPADGSWISGVVTPDPAVVDRIADLGFASVRIPVRWSDFAADEAPYTIEEGFHKKVDALVDRALERGLKVIINVHHFNEFYEAPLERLDEFLGIWRQLSEHYEGYSDDLIFEVLNEPHGNMDQGLWEAIYPPALMIIRERHPERAVILGGAPWNSWEGLVDLQLPERDKHIIATFHYYLPFEFTHQGADWTDLDLETEIPFNATIDELTAMAAHFAQIAEWAKKHEVPVNMGEFGAYSVADMESRVRYTRAVRTLADAFGFSWHYWEFGSGFGIWDPKTDSYREGLRDALLKDSE